MYSQTVFTNREINEELIHYFSHYCHSHIFYELSPDYDPEEYFRCSLSPECTEDFMWYEVYTPDLQKLEFPHLWEYFWVPSAT